MSVKFPVSNCFNIAALKGKRDVKMDDCQCLRNLGSLKGLMSSQLHRMAMRRAPGSAAPDVL